MRDENLSEIPKYRKAIFTAEFLFGGTIEGWTDGSDWNGWATPLYEFPEAQKLVALYRELNGESSARYDSKSDTFTFFRPDDDQPDEYGAMEIVVDGRQVRVYPIGTSCWIWEEADSDG